MMQDKAYPDFPSHKKTHDDFVKTLGTLSAPVSSESIHFAKDWYVYTTRLLLLIIITSRSSARAPPANVLEIMNVYGPRPAEKHVLIIFIHQTMVAEK